MLFFVNDYAEGAAPEILKRLAETNLDKEYGYGEDRFSLSAKEKIARLCAIKPDQIWFLAGGTQTNQVVLDNITESGEGIFAAKTGHINLHEAGAIEFTGHKVIPLNGIDGKIDNQALTEYMENFLADESHEHMVQPGAVYLSHPSEYGTLYRKHELEEIASTCKKYGLRLFLDGARLGYGLASKESDLTIADIAALTDVFSIGGTKVGALIGEAVVFAKENRPKHFLNSVKRHGALLAKGRLIGIQFDTLFTDNLYERLSAHAIKQADRIREAMREKGYTFYIESPTNQLFPILENEKLRRLKEQVAVSFWEKYDDCHTVIRIATSWATDPNDVEELIRIL